MKNAVLDILKLIHKKVSEGCRFQKEIIAPKDQYDQYLRVSMAHAFYPVICEYIQLNQEDQKKADLLEKVNLLKQKALYKELGGLFHELNQRTIPYVHIKGITLAIAAYWKPGYRSFNDIDLLIDKRDRKVLTEILQQHGFNQEKLTVDHNMVSYSNLDKMYYIVNTHQLAPFIKKTSNPLCPYISIDLNFSLLWGEEKNRKIDITSFIEDRVPFTFYGSEFYILNPEKNLLQICLHAYKDLNSIFIMSVKNPYTIKTFHEIYLFIKNTVIDWNSFILLVKQNGLANFIYTIFYYLSELFEDRDIVCIAARIKPEDSETIHTFGLTEEEKYFWNIDIKDRLCCENLSDKVQSQLTEKHRKKLLHNHEHL